MVYLSVFIRSKVHYTYITVNSIFCNRKEYSQCRQIRTDKCVYNTRNKNKTISSISINKTFSPHNLSRLEIYIPALMYKNTLIDHQVLTDVPQSWKKVADAADAILKTARKTRILLKSRCKNGRRWGLRRGSSWKTIENVACWDPEFSDYVEWGLWWSFSGSVG